VGDRVGKGAVGEVFKGKFYWDGGQEGGEGGEGGEAIPVAVKIFDQTSIAFSVSEFLSEVSLLSVLHHPSLLHSPAACIQPPHLYIVTQFSEGGTLADRIFPSIRDNNNTEGLPSCGSAPLPNSDSGVFTPPSPPSSSLSTSLPACPLTYLEILALLGDVGEGLKYLHKRGVVHGDIKPDNILLEWRVSGDGLGRWCAVVCDFGCAKWEGDEVRELGGTLVYTCPELLAKEEEEGEGGEGKGKEKQKGKKKRWMSCVDIYALGITMWQVFHKNIPYTDHQGRKMGEFFEKVLGGFREEINRNVVKEEAMAEAIEGCWEHDVKKRWRAGEVVERMRSLERDERTKQEAAINTLSSNSNDDIVRRSRVREVRSGSEEVC